MTELEPRKGKLSLSGLTQRTIAGALGGGGSTSPGLERLLKSNALVYVVLALVLVISAAVSPGFLEYQHLTNILRLASFLGIAAIGQTLVIITGGIDLSIASTITLTNIIAAQLMDGSNANIPAALVAVVVTGLLVGLANGAGVRLFRIPPLVMTLGVGSVVQGIALLYSKGAPKGNAAPLLTSISNEMIGGVATGVILIWILLSIITVVVLRLTVFGRAVHATGTNPQATWYSGINVSNVTMAVYMISGVAAAIVGMLLVGYTGTSFLDSGTKYSMNSIAAVIIGGTSILGGKGSYTGTIAGSIIMIMLESLLTIINIPESGRQIAQGLIILMMVFIYGREKSKRV